jgi:hypothetical protein
MDGGRALRASRTKRIFVHVRAHVTTRRAARTVNLRASARAPFLFGGKKRKKEKEKKNSLLPSGRSFIVDSATA